MEDRALHQAHAHVARRPQRESDDLALVLRARNGDGRSLDALIRRYNGFVRLKASSYFLAGGDGEDLQQEGLIGLYKAIRDYRVDKDTSFRSFAELCITRQIITAIKGATRYKHGPLNGYISFSHTPAGQDADSGDCTIGDTLAASNVHDPANRVISSRGPRGAGRRARREPVEARGTGAGAVHGGRVVRGRSASGSTATPRPSTTRCSESSARSARISTRASSSASPTLRLGLSYEPHDARAFARLIADAQRAFALAEREALEPFGITPPVFGLLDVIARHRRHLPGRSGRGARRHASDRDRLAERPPRAGPRDPRRVGAGRPQGAADADRGRRHGPPGRRRRDSAQTHASGGLARSIRRSRPTSWTRSTACLRPARAPAPGRRPAARRRAGAGMPGGRAWPGRSPRRPPRTGASGRGAPGARARGRRRGAGPAPARAPGAS